MGPPRRKRTQLRVESRRDAKAVRDRQRLATLEPGGTPERPLEVVTASLVEPKARAIRCPVCRGSVRVAEHAARTLGGVPLRLAHVACPMCGHARVIYFVVRPRLPN
jgi:hypothetical protein